jgi:hypothetical protein
MDSIKVDELIWTMTSIAHDAIEHKKDLKELYPELIPFLEHIVLTYPALQRRCNDQ